MNKLFLIPLLFLVVGLFPNVYAVHPIPVVEIFDDEILSWCYEESELNKVTIDGTTTNAASTIESVVEVLRERISDNSNMNIKKDPTCDAGDNAITAHMANDPYVIATVSPYSPFDESQQKLLLYNIERLDIVSVGECVDGGVEDTLLSIATEPEPTPPSPPNKNQIQTNVVDDKEYDLD